MDPVVRALQKALQSRIDSLREVNTTRVEVREVFRRGEITFLQVEICRDHLALDVWLPEALREEARSSGIARAHPFLGVEAVVIRFERAQDLARVARWVEASHEWAPVRDQAPRPSQVPQALIPSLEERLIRANSSRPSSPPPPPADGLAPDQRMTEPPAPAAPTEPPPPPLVAAPASARRNGQAKSTARASAKPKSKPKAGQKSQKPKLKAAPKKAPTAKKAPAKKSATKKPTSKARSSSRKNP